MTSTKQITKKGFICIFRTCVFFPPRSLFIGPSVVLVLLTLAHSLNTRRFQSRILPPFDSKRSTFIFPPRAIH